MDDEEDEMIKFVQKITQSSDITSHELALLLDGRSKNKIQFILIDIREIFEYSSLSIKGTDLLLPTSSIHTSIEQLNSIKSHFLIFYCRTGSRTFQMLNILRKMGFTNIAHLTRGIVDFSGEKLKNASLPKNIK